MGHFLMRSDEAEWTGTYRVWSHVQLFPPRQGTLRGHVIAAAIGLLAAVVLIILERGVTG